MFRRSSLLALFFAAVSSAPAAFGQAQFEWARAFNSQVAGGYPTFSQDHAAAAAVDAAGNVYLTGWVDWNGGFGIPQYHDPLTLKYDRDGNLLWSQRYQANVGVDRGNAIAVDPCGYQTYYHNPDASFCATPPGATWNVSSGVRITWSH